MTLKELCNAKSFTYAIRGNASMCCTPNSTSVILAHPTTVNITFFLTATRREFGQEKCRIPLTAAKKKLKVIN